MFSLLQSLVRDSDSGCCSCVWSCWTSLVKPLPVCCYWILRSFDSSSSPPLFPIMLYIYYCCHVLAINKIGGVVICLVETSGFRYLLLLCLAWKFWQEITCFLTNLLVWFFLFPFLSCSSLQINFFLQNFEIKIKRHTFTNLCTYILHTRTPIIINFNLIFYSLLLSHCSPLVLVGFNTWSFILE